MPKLTRGTVIGIDYGLKQMGLACGEIEIGVAHPLQTLKETKQAKKLAYLLQLQQEWLPIAFVMGVPLINSHMLSDFARVCVNFAHKLVRRSELPVYLIDESYSSCNAEIMLKECSFALSQHKLALDMFSAQGLLQAFFTDGSYHCIKPSSTLTATLDI